MNDLYIHTASGAIYRPGQIVGGIQTHAGMTDAAWADLGCVPYVAPPPEPTPPQPSLYASLASEPSKRAAFAAFRAQFLTLAGALAQAGLALPEPLTFRAMAALLLSLPGDGWTRGGLALRLAYDDVLFACGGSMDSAYAILPELLADETLGE